MKARVSVFGGYISVHSTVYSVQILSVIEIKFANKTKKQLKLHKVIFSDWQCHEVPLFVIGMFVIDHKEKVNLKNCVLLNENYVFL